MESKKRGRQAILLNKVDLQACIDKLESENVFTARSQLWVAVEQTDFAKSCTPRPLTSQTAMLKAEALKIEIKTPKGKRGNPAGLAGVVRTGRRIKLKMAASTLTKLKANFPSSQHAILDRASKGSMKAAIKAKCLDCSCNVPKEVAQCLVNDCPLWTFRPYQSLKAVILEGCSA